MPTAKGVTDNKSLQNNAVSNIEKIFKLAMKAIQIFNDSGGATAVQIFSYVRNNHRVPLADRELKDCIKESLKRGILAGILRRRSGDGKYYIFPGTKFALTKRLPMSQIFGDYMPPIPKPKPAKKDGSPDPRHSCSARNTLIPKVKPREVKIVSQPRVTRQYIKSGKHATKGNPSAPHPTKGNPSAPHPTKGNPSAPRSKSSPAPASKPSPSPTNKPSRKSSVKVAHHRSEETGTNTSTEKPEKSRPSREPPKSKHCREKTIIPRPRDVILLQDEKAARNAQKNSTKEKIKSLKRKLAKETEDGKLSSEGKRTTERRKSKIEGTKENTSETSPTTKNSDAEKEVKASN